DECWKMEIEPEDLAPFMPEIKNWRILPTELKVHAVVSLIKQIRPIKRKQAFLSLLTDSVAQTYFDEDFRSCKVVIPHYEITPEMSGRVLIEFFAANLSRAVAQHGGLAMEVGHDLDDSDSGSYSDSEEEPPTSISGQSDNGGPL
ncbi:MAG TPA: hypothetical protein VIJ14_10050, partial [Rhabdochlamydiaceae bacterium]